MAKARQPDVQVGQRPVLATLISAGAGIPAGFQKLPRIAFS